MPRERTLAQGDVSNGTTTPASGDGPATTVRSAAAGSGEPRGTADPPDAIWAPRRSLASMVFAPVSDGAVRRRGSDAIRVAVSVAGILLCWVAVATSNKANLDVAKFLTPPPEGTRWLVSSVWWAASLGTFCLLILAALLSRRRTMVRDVLVAGVAAAGFTAGLHILWGNAGYEPPPGQAPTGISLALPVLRITIVVAMAAAASPHLRRALQIAVKVAILSLAIAALLQGSGTPLAVVASILLGWGTAALVHLVFGSPLGLPSRADVVALLAELGVPVHDLEPAPDQVWGVARFRAIDDQGIVDSSVYGRDASDAQFVGKVARFIFYRDSGPHLALTRAQQIEHEAYLTLLAQRAGARVPSVIAAGSAGVSHDAVLVTRPPVGTPLATLLDAARARAAEAAAAEDAAAEKGVDEKAAATERGSGAATPDNTVADNTVADNTVADNTVADNGDAPDRVGPVVAPPGLLEPGELTDEAVRDVLAQVLTLRRARLAHGSIGPHSIILGPGDRGADGGATGGSDGNGHGPHDTVGLVDFRCASSGAPDERLHRDVAATLSTLGAAAGVERTVAAALDVLPHDVLVDALPFLQKAAIGPAATPALKGRKAVLTALREQGAAAAGVEVPALTEPRRVSWANLIMVIGTVIGGWALLLVLIDVSKSFDTIKGADWSWVALVFVFAQLAYPTEAVTVVGSVVDPIPFGRATALEVANTFVALAAGSMGCLATRVRFFQKQGYNATLAVSSGVLVSTVSWVVKGALFLISIPFAIGSMHFHEPSSSSGGSHSKLVWLIVLAVVAVAVLAGVVLLVPRLRRLAADKARPKVSEMWGHLKMLSAHPRNLVEVFGGCIASQLFVAFALGASLHAFGEHLPLSVLLVVITLASVLGGISPVPGGMGVVEAGMILGLTAAGIPESQAVAATFVQRLFTSYLPPIWGWFVLAFMRKRDYL